MSLIFASVFVGLLLWFISHVIAGKTAYAAFHRALRSGSQLSCVRRLFFWSKTLFLVLCVLSLGILAVAEVHLPHDAEFTLAHFVLMLPIAFALSFCLELSLSFRRIYLRLMRQRRLRGG